MNSAKSTKENNLTWKTTVRVKKNRVTSADLQDPPVQTQLVSRLKHFAREAQFTGDYHQAAQYYIELAVMEPSEPTHWFHIGSHFMLTKDYLKANESFLMALSIHPAHQTSLIMCGILEAMFEHHKEAETLLKQATTTESPGVIPWTVLGLLYENQNNFIQAERAFLEANSQMRQNTEDTKRQKDEECGVSVETIQFLLQNNALQMAEQALSKLLLCSDDGRSVSYLFFLAQWQLLRTEYENAADTLKEILSHGSQDADVWALNGHCQYLLKAFSKSVKSYEQSLDLFPLPSDIHFVLLRLGSIYFLEKQYERAKDVYLRACRHTPSCLTWLGLGMACYKLEKLDEAESALNEATNFNFQNAEMWGYLCQISLRCGREEEAKQAYHFATKFNLKESFIKEIEELQEKVHLSVLSATSPEEEV